MSVKTPILSQIALLVETAGYCGVAEKTGNTTYYIYKGSKFTQTVKCKV